MTNTPDHARSTDQPDMRSGPPNGGLSRKTVQATRRIAGGAAIGAPPAVLLRHFSLSALAKAQGDPLYRSLSAENRRLADHLHGLEAELASLRGELTRATSDALTDPLTGLANRRAFDEALEAAAARACAASPAQLLIADIDHFKTLNDTHGHQFGDAVLRITGEVLKAAVRRGTLAARIGGDEFALLLPGSAAGDPVNVETVVIAQRLCARIAQRPLTDRGHPERQERVTLSIGLAGWQPGESPVDWYNRADDALYAAKRAGRNQVVEAVSATGRRPSRTGRR